MSTVPECAHRCPLVTMLVIAQARAVGLTEQQMRVSMGLQGEDHEAVEPVHRADSPVKR